VKALQWLPFDVSKVQAGFRSDKVLDPFRWLLVRAPSKASASSSTPRVSGTASKDDDVIRAKYQHVQELCKTAYSMDQISLQEKRGLQDILTSIQDGSTLAALAGAAFSLRHPLMTATGGKIKAAKVVEGDEGSQMLLSSLQGVDNHRQRMVLEWVIQGCPTERLPVVSWEWSTRGENGSGDAGSTSRSGRAGFLPKQSDVGVDPDLYMLGPAAQLRSTLMVQLAVHVALRASCAAGTWWMSLLTEPMAQAAGYLPAMPGNEIAFIMRSMGLRRLVSLRKGPLVLGRQLYAANASRQMPRVWCGDWRQGSQGRGGREATWCREGGSSHHAAHAKGLPHKQRQREREQ